MPRARLYPSEEVFPSEDLYPGEGDELASRSPGLRVREPVPMRQYILATTPRGKTYRWGEDEANADHVFEDLTDSDSVPGGCKELSVSLPRKANVDYDDMTRGTRIELRGAGQHTVWLGTLQDTPRTSGDKLVIAPAAVGYQDDLTLDESAQCIPLDSDMSGWGDPSAARKALSPGAKFNQNAQVQLLPAGSPETGGVPAISHSWANMNTTPSSPDVAESWYDSGGIELGQVMLDFDNVKGDGGAPWNTGVLSLKDDIATGGTFESLINFNAVDYSHAVLTTAQARRFLLLLQSWFGGERVGATGN